MEVESNVFVQVTIPLSGYVDTAASGYSKLIAFEQVCSKYRDCCIHIDLEDLRWFDANLSALFEAILFRLFKTKNLRFTLDVDLVKNRFPILLRNGFLSDLYALPDNAGTTIPIGTFFPTEVQEFVSYIDDKLLSHPSLRLEEERLYNMRTHFLELFANIELHAKTTMPIFACGQYYPKSYKLKFTLVDLGIGYLAPIQAFTKNAVSDASAAIAWALADTNTTKVATKPGGLGLKELHAHCRSQGGELHIGTGNAYWNSKLPAARSTTQVMPLSGSIINVVFNCR